MNEVIAWLAKCKKRSPYVSCVRCTGPPQLGGVGLGVDCNGCENRRYTRGSIVIKEVQNYLMTISDSFTSWLTRVRSSMLTRRAFALGWAATRDSASSRELLAKASFNYSGITKNRRDTTLTNDQLDIRPCS